MNHNSSQIIIEKIIPEELSQKRLDLALSLLLPDYSRARIQEWIKSNQITIDGKILKPKDKVTTGQKVLINAAVDKITKLEPQKMDLDVIYEDEDIIIVNKPPGLIIHPGAGNPKNTLLNALLYHYPELAKLPRAGIIHRLDKDTSGLLVITHNLTSHNILTQALQNREIKREYEAIVNGVIMSGGTINAPIGRHHAKRTHMAITPKGKLAITHYRIIKKYDAYTHIKVILETGRTHQIRVHMAYIGHPLIGDPNYNKINKISEKIPLELKKQLENFKRQALHARRLELVHPRTGRSISWKIEPPKDFKNLIEALDFGI